jgi:hypothetical protein
MPCCSESDTEKTASSILRQFDENPAATNRSRQYATHKHPKVKLWLARHRRFHIHFIPTSASWLNMIERFFRDLTVNRIRHGVFRNVIELVESIEDSFAQHNNNPKPSSGPLRPTIFSKR